MYSKTCNHSLDTQIIIKKNLYIFFTQYKTEWEEGEFQGQKVSKK